MSLIKVQPCAFQFWYFIYDGSRSPPCLMSVFVCCTLKMAETKATMKFNSIDCLVNNVYSIKFACNIRICGVNMLKLMQDTFIKVRIINDNRKIPLDSLEKMEFEFWYFFADSSDSQRLSRVFFVHTFVECCWVYRKKSNGIQSVDLHLFVVPAFPTVWFHWLMHGNVIRSQWFD